MITTVEDLIKHLQQFDPKLPVVLEHTDHTNWTYTWNLNLFNIDEEKDVSVDEEEEIDIDDYPKAVVIQCTPWEDKN